MNEVQEYQGPKITAIGVGGCGCNAVDNMMAVNLEGVSFLCIDTDKEALKKRSAMQLYIGHGQDPSASPEAGKAAAAGSLDAIQTVIDGSDMIFIIAGMGGSTGTGAAPVIARAAREKDLLTVGIVTTPFLFEGKKRREASSEGIEEFLREVDCIFVLSNDRLLAQHNGAIKEQFKKADEKIYAVLRCLTAPFNRPGFICGDFMDLYYILKSKGIALMGEGRSKGGNRALEAAQRAMEDLFPADLSVSGFKTLFVNVTANSDLGIEEFHEASQVIQDAAGNLNDDAPEIFMLMTLDENCREEILITVIATGIEMANA